MKTQVPEPVAARPAFWPWATGQELGVTERHVVTSDAMLLLWSNLAPTRPHHGWDAGPFLSITEQEIDAELTHGVLTTLERYRLARFEPEFTAWCRNHPLMRQPVRKPPLLGWPLTLQHLDVWWYLAHPESNRAWSLSQAQERCPVWTAERVHELQQAGLAKDFVRVAPRR